MNKQKAYSTIVVKSMDEDKRIIRGIASTPTTDRMDDIVMPNGAKFTLPIPFLWQHNHDEPIGQITAAKVTDKGIEIEAQLVKVDAPSQLAARLEEAWQSIKTGLVRGLSIGFRILKYNVVEATGGYEILEWDWYELSAVTIPANVEATITSIKTFSEQTAATGNKSGQKILPASGIKPVKINPRKKEVKTMNYKEMIKRLEATIAEKQKERDDIQKAVADEGRTKDAAEREAFDTLNDEIKALQLEVKDLQELEAQNVANAAPVEGDMPEGVKQYAGIAVHKAPEKLEKGIAFARFAASLGSAKGDIHTAKSIAEHRFPEDKRLHHVMKSAVAAGTTTDTDWASKLVEYNEISTDFVEFLRPKTLIGRFGTEGIPALRSIPFNVHIKGQTAASTAGWVGEGQHKPVTSGKYDSVHMAWAKLAAISVATDELLRFSNPSAEKLIRDDLAAAVIQVMDNDFIDITNVGNDPIKPASITYNYGGSNEYALPASVTGAAEAQIAALWSIADSSHLDASSAVYITTPAVARKLAGLVNAAGTRRYPLVTPIGGSIDGIPLLVSTHVNANGFILAFASEIWLADDGIVTLDASREASLIMDSAPQSAFDKLKKAIAQGDLLDSTDIGETELMAALNDIKGGTSVNMFQTNMVAFRAERYINWKRRRANAVNVANAEDWT